MPFTELSRRLGEQMNGTEYTVKIPLLPDPRVVITSSRVYPSNEDTVFAFELDGSVKGTLYVRSRIWYDAIRKVIRIEWWNFTLDTSRELLRSAVWLYERLIDPSFGTLLQSGVAIDMRPLLTQLDADLNSAMNRPIGTNVVLRSELQPVDLVGLSATETDLVIVARVAGKISVGLHAGPIPTGDEVRSFSVHFLTQDDNKDEDEPVLVQLVRSGVGLPGRWLFHELELRNNQTAGPYRLTVPAGAVRGQCGLDRLRIYKQPDSEGENGSGWNTADYREGVLRRRPGARHPAPAIREDRR